MKEVLIKDSALDKEVARYVDRVFHKEIVDMSIYQEGEEDYIVHGYVTQWDSYEQEEEEIEVEFKASIFKDDFGWVVEDMKFVP